ncbi:MULTISPECIES: multiubiquitin domain-containing protein [unclassified Pseudomonas]|uniref:multiubiquitin domain-containing protein n=1 Tax=unclassified Pseudomonas TaxID=196821 RepID=UPI002448EFA9|nr:MULTISPECIES: multiubiquitin domain-containing protein [unclassified Pseudomonas]MDG9927968.1 multiubiquitin domain-containing protein [Pseudomonas sp. GD04042]MDH0481977.1 multiubiquitin domain-containing protein [Pseudomonas sp. GD04015]MDH0604128.1 multiubiquitin domain-containing protein [Pseudomonas sp. GD03869]
MQHTNSQHPSQSSVEVANQTLAYRQVSVVDNTPTGAQIAAAAGFSPDQLPVVLQVLATGSLEDIRPDEVVTLQAGVNRFIVIESDRNYLITVDGARLEWPCSLITGQTLRKLAGVAEDKKLLLEQEDEADLEIQDDQFVDLDQPQIERFISRSRKWKLNVQGDNYEFDTPDVPVRDAIIKAGMNPDQPWHIYLKVAGQPKQELSINDVINLRTPGIEKLRLTTRDVGNGEAPQAPRRGFSLLPGDEQYLSARGYRWETVLNGTNRWLLIHDYELPEGYSHDKVEMALLVPSDYPMAQVDMFYVYPPLSLANGAGIPATQVTGNVDNVTFQGWSRHRPWNPATDTIISQLAMVDGCLLKEVGQ